MEIIGKETNILVAKVVFNNAVPEGSSSALRLETTCQTLQFMKSVSLHYWCSDRGGDVQLCTRLNNGQECFKRTQS